MRLLKTLAVAASVALAFSVPANAETATIKVAQVKALTWAAWMALPETAKDGDTDVNFEMSGFNSSADVLLAVQTGQIDIGPTALSVVASAFANADNLPFKMIAGVGDGTTALVVRPEAGIEDFEDLRGKRIGAVRGSSELIKLKIAMTSAGMDLDKDTELTTLNSPTDQVLALQRGDLDGIVTYAPFATQAEKVGGVRAEKINNVLMAEAGTPTVIIANDKVIEEHPEAVQAAISAYVDNWNKFDVDREFWVDSYLKSGSGERDLLLEAVKGLPIQYELDEDKIVRVTKNLAKFKVIPEDTSEELSKLLDYTFLVKASGKSAEELGKR